MPREPESFLGRHAPMSLISCATWDDIHNLNFAKKSEAGEERVSDTAQHSLPVGGLGKKTRNRHGARYGAKNDEKVALPLTWGCTRHQLRPAIPKLLHQVRSPFSNTQFGAGNLRRQRYNRTARAGVITMLGREVPPNDLFPPILRRHIVQ